MTILDTRRRWLALYVLCLGDLLIVLDVSIVNVALPSIREDLGFSEASLAWVVNAYILTFTANVVGVLWSAAMFAWFFIAALYLQLVLEYTPLEVGLAFLPANLIMGALSLGLSARIVMRFGIKLPVVTGMLLVALGLALFARAPVDGSFVVDVLPSMVVLGLGVGMAMNPLLLAAMSDVEPEEAGLASGVVNTAFMMGGALGLAVLASLAAARTNGDSLAALTTGYHAAFVVGALFAAAAAVIAGVLLRAEAPAGAGVPAVEAH